MRWHSRRRTSCATAAQADRNAIGAGIGTNYRRARIAGKPHYREQDDESADVA